MTSIKAILKKALAAFIGIFLMLTTPTAKPQAHTVKDKENCKLNFTVVSDVHMESNNRSSRERYVKMLRDIKATEGGNDALVFLGDNTMNGQDIENLCFYGIYSLIKPVDYSKMYTIIGNHDTGNNNGKDGELRLNFWSYYNAFTGRNVQEPYYYYDIIDGSYFVFLTTEGDSHNTANISDEQLTWLDSVLSKAEETDSPTFIFTHHPLYSSSTSIQIIRRIYSILMNHSNCFIFSGHTHSIVTSIEDLGNNSYSINLPKCIDVPTEDWEQTGQGVQVEVYENEVIMRSRCFYNSTWGKEYKFNIGK